MLEDTNPDGEPTSLDFAHAVRIIGLHMRAMELGAVPAFRSPPRDPQANRTIRRHANGSPPTIAVRCKGRTRREVILDLIAGALATTALMPNSPTAGQFRGRVIKDLGVDCTPPANRHGEEPY